MHSPELNYVVEDGVAVLTLHRPERMNAWTPDLELALKACLESAQEDAQVRCVVITGAGRAFCAGMDMDVLRTVPASEAKKTADEAADEPRYSYLAAFEKPLIAAINGAAAGVGLCIALYCDLRFVAAGAKLTAPYARRGLVAEHGLAWLLPRLIGPMHAADLLISGRTISAEEAAAMGLANLLPADGFLDAVLQRAQTIAASTSPRSVRIIKQQLLQARSQDLAEATRVANREIAACRHTEDFQEGVRHFLEKRPPRFTGK